MEKLELYFKKTLKVLKVSGLLEEVLAKLFLPNKD